MARPVRYSSALSSSLLKPCPRCIHLQSTPARYFSTGLPTQVMAYMPPGTLKEAAARLPSRKSKKVEMKDMTVGKVPNDVGFLPETFIRPSRHDMPSMLSKKWKSRLKVEWLWARTRFQNLLSLFWFIWWNQRKLPKARRMPLDLRRRPLHALSLHKEFYTSLAAGSLPHLRTFLCSGLLDSSRDQLTKRAEMGSPSQDWQLLRYTSALRLPKFLWRLIPWPLNTLLPGTQAKVVSDRVLPLPMGKGIWMRQCVVRIKSRQRLDRNDGSAPRTADLTEYIVMQQLKLPNSQDIAWKLWGTVKPTGKEEMAQLLHEDGKSGAGSGTVTMMDRLKAMDLTRRL